MAIRETLISFIADCNGKTKCGGNFQKIQFEVPEEIRSKFKVQGE